MSCYDRKDLGLLLLRLGAGGVLAAHGAQKLLGWFGGGGIAGASAFMASIGYRPAKASAIAAGTGETSSGVLLALGLATPMAGGIAVGTMAGASAAHAPQGFWSQSGGYEYPVALGLIGASLAVAGPGRLSLDEALGDRLDRTWMVPVALATALAGAAAVIGARERRLRDEEKDGEPDGDEAGDEATGLA
ncbi:DoxX family protein [Streptomyces physcomitrii]|uniref:DoxX family protein n=1 Tax=Streptomyces physcomitrii TaxID=2724184 RepID=UPI0033CF9D20